MHPHVGFRKADKMNLEGEERNTSVAFDIRLQTPNHLICLLTTEDNS